VQASGLRIKEKYDGSFSLDPEAEQFLTAYLGQQNFHDEVVKQAGWDKDTKIEFTGKLFMPVPWSPAERKGMPQEFEKYLADKDNYQLVNVPPTFMFNAKIFRPSRLCAVMSKAGAAEPPDVTTE